MKTAKILFALLATFMLSSFAHAQSSEEAQTSNVIKINLLQRFGWSWEIKTAARQTLYLQTGILPRLNLNFENRRLITSDFFILPGLDAQYRFYYNLQKRADKGKRVQLNSGEYLGPAARVWYSREPVRGAELREDYRFVYSLGGVWGFQRNLQSRLSLEYQIGPGVMFAQGTDISITGREVRSIAPTLLGGFTLGFWLNKAPR